MEALRAAADAAARAALPRLTTCSAARRPGVLRRRGARGRELGPFRSTEEGAAGLGGWERPGRRSGRRRIVFAPLQLAARRPGLRGKGEHTDVGVAVVMTPALLVDPRGDEGGLKEADDGASSSRGLTLGGLHPILPRDAVLVMLGEGARAWYPDGDVARAIAVPTHEMSLDSLLLGQQRAWFGRMVFPAPGTPLPRKGIRSSSDDVGEDVDDDVEMTFGEWRARVGAAFVADGDDAKAAVLAAAACGDFLGTSSAPETSSPSASKVRRRRVLADDASCALGEVYCWHACVPEPPAGCAAGTVAKCVQPGSNKIWPENFGSGGHCSDCVAWCVADQQSNASRFQFRAIVSQPRRVLQQEHRADIHVHGRVAGWSDRTNRAWRFYTATRR